MTPKDLDFLNKRTKKYDVVIGIDPDSKASGISYLTVANKVVRAETFAFPFLLDFLTTCVELFKKDTLTFVVIVEASWLRQTKNGNTANWHLKEEDNKNVASAKGEGIARNQQTGRLIVEMCKHWNIDVIEKAPLVKTWSGPDRKITQEEIEYFIPGFPKRSNQEMRDSTLICWDFAGFPIRVKPRTT